MPTMAMERSMEPDFWKSYSTSSTKQFTPSRRGLRERGAFEEAERERELRDSLVARANAATAVATVMAAQQEKMLAGLLAVGQRAGGHPTSPTLTLTLAH